MRTVNIHGFEFQVESEPDDYWGWIERGHYQAEVGVIRSFASPDKLFIDAGAWIGAYTLYASRLYKHVHAFEPDPVAFQILSKNVSANNLSNVSLYEWAFMNHVGTTNIGSTMLGCSCTRQSCPENSVEVNSMTLRYFCQEIAERLFIKMDVEGAESEILKDFAFFAEHKPDMMLSAHLDWWREAGSDGKREYATINQVAKLYKSAFTTEGVRAELNSAYGELVLTDQWPK